MPPSETSETIPRNLFMKDTDALIGDDYIYCVSSVSASPSVAAKLSKKCKLTYKITGLDDTEAVDVELFAKLQRELSDNEEHLETIRNILFTQRRELDGLNLHLSRVDEVELIAQAYAYLKKFWHKDIKGPAHSQYLLSQFLLKQKQKHILEDDEIQYILQKKYVKDDEYRFTDFWSTLAQPVY